MKDRKGFKVLAAALAMLFISGAVAGAQGVEISGYLNSGVAVHATDKDGTDPKFLVAGVDSEQPFGKLRLHIDYTNSTQNAGVNFLFMVQGQESLMPALRVSIGSAWVKPFDMLTLKFGILDDWFWQTSDFIYCTDWDEGFGVLMRLNPIAGLDFGFGAYTDTSRISNFNNTSYPKSMQDIKYTFSFSYTMQNAFKIMAHAGINTNDYNFALKQDVPRVTNQALVEFRLLSVKNLNTSVIAKVSGLEKDFIDRGAINFYESINYRAGNVHFGLNAAQYIYMSRDFPSFHFNPFIRYMGDKLIPRIDFNYFYAGFRTNDYHYHRRAFTTLETLEPLSPTLGDVKDYDVYCVRPVLRLMLDPRISFDIGDAVYFEKKDGKRSISNVFYLDVIIRF